MILVSHWWVSTSRWAGCIFSSELNSKITQKNSNTFTSTQSKSNTCHALEAMNNPYILAAKSVLDRRHLSPSLIVNSSIMNKLSCQSSTPRLCLLTFDAIRMNNAIRKPARYTLWWKISNEEKRANSEFLCVSGTAIRRLESWCSNTISTICICQIWTWPRQHILTGRQRGQWLHPRRIPRRVNKIS